jgi:catechol 2,3-dioxygenase-like lactoylglutathione lyase family enzyme
MIQAIGVHIKVSNFQVSKKFYEALGFRQVFLYGPDQKVKEAYNGVVFEHGGCKLEIADGHRAVKPEVFSSKMENSKISLMVPVDSIGKIIRICKENNFLIAVGPRHYYWNTLELVVKDPNGVVLVFNEPYTEESAKNLNADETFGKPF